ncbi:MAG: isopentenyl-diphosphate Delta-isomerase [Longimicrobiales bacterium]
MRPQQTFGPDARGSAPAREDVILVDDYDTPLGIAEKLHVHHTGQLHRAVSVFLFDPRGSMWLQRRALHKYHTPGLWTNACCTHPRPGERPIDAARRRVAEELGVECPDLQAAFRLLYRASLDHGMIEHEYDHVFSGLLNTKPIPNPAEVAAVRCVSPAQLRRCANASRMVHTLVPHCARAHAARARNAEQPAAGAVCPDDHSQAGGVVGRGLSIGKLSD